MAVFPFLAGCPTPPTSSGSGTRGTALPGKTQAPPETGLVREGRPYDVLAQESLLTILVFRGGALAKAGHNHVIASRALHGTFYVPADPARTSFEVGFPVAELTVDETPLRARENEADFPPDVSDSAKEGTRKNMLGNALLDANHYPEVTMRSLSLEAAHGLGTEWRAHVEVTVRGRASTVVVPVHYEQHADEIVLSGDFPLKQTDLGLTPFSALLGALQVVDDMNVRFHIVARVAPTHGAHAPD